MKTIFLLPTVLGFSSFTPLKPPTKSDETIDKAKTTWETVALAQPEAIDSVQTIPLGTCAKVFHHERYQEFLKVRGTYFVNGLSTCQVGDRLVHPFEAHGFVKCLSFDGNGSLVMKTAFVETPLTKAERWLRTPLARGGMSQLGNPVLNALSPSTRDTANLSVTLWPPPGHNLKPMLIAGGDNGSPYRLDPNSLKTIGKLEAVVPELRGKSMLAHTRIDSSRQRLILCSSRFDTSEKSSPGGASTVLEFMEFDTDFKMVSSQEYTMRFAVVHDWMLTEDYYVVPKNPAQFEWDNLPDFLLGRKRAVEIFRMDEDLMGELVLVPRHSQGLPLEFKSDSFFNLFHFGPCRQDEVDKSLTIYGAVFDHYKFGSEMGFDVASQAFDPTRWCTSGDAPAPRFDMFRVNLRDPAVAMERTRIPILDGQTDVPVDMPTFHGTRYVYFLGAARPKGWFPFRSLVKLDTVEGNSWNWDFGDDSVVSEPMFIPVSSGGISEEDGFVISIINNAAEDRSDLVVFDSAHFEAGPICLLPLGRLMPWSVHGFWQDDFFTRHLH